MARRKTASLYRESGTWYVSYWRDGKRIRESTGTHIRKIAEEIRSQREREMILGTVDIERRIEAALKDPSRREPLMRMLEQPASACPPNIWRAVRMYLKQSRIYKRKKTIAADRGRMKHFFRNAGVKVISQVTTSMVSDYFAARAKEISATTILRYREVLHAFYEWARKRKFVLENPVADVERPSIPPRDISFLSLEEIDVCLAAVKDDLIEGVVATAIYAGLRREEICWLTWDDVDLTGQKTIRVRAKTVDGGTWMPKTKRNRVVPISKQLMGYLGTLPLPRKGWVFKSPEGHRWNPDNLGHRAAELMARAGLPWMFLDWRHSFGSHLAQRNVSDFKIAQLMGNSPEIVRRHYARLVPEEMHADVDFGTRAIQAGTR